MNRITFINPSLNMLHNSLYHPSQYHTSISFKLSSKCRTDTGTQTVRVKRRFTNKVYMGAAFQPSNRFCFYHLHFPCNKLQNVVAFEYCCDTGLNLTNSMNSPTHFKNLYNTKDGCWDIIISFSLVLYLVLCSGVIRSTNLETFTFYCWHAVFLHEHSSNNSDKYILCK